MNALKTKWRRRMNKYRNIIMKDFGIDLCEFPTKVVVVCNGGLVNGINREMVFEAFEMHGPIENIAMIPRKSYCFVSFKESASSAAAYDTINAKEIWEMIKGPVFLAFTEKLPDSLNVKMDFDDKPPGLHVIENFVSEDEERLILSIIAGRSARGDDVKSSHLKNRKVAHFGYEFKYSDNNVDVREPIEKIPEELDFVWDKILDLGLDIGFRPDQLTVNNYRPGQGIPAHVDTHSAFEDPIVSLSLQSSVIMEFRNSNGKCCSIFLPARSICIMSGDSRYGWTHCIATRKSDVVPSSAGGLTLHRRGERTSLTYRKVKQTASCNCKFPRFCDARKKSSTTSVERTIGISLPEDAAAKIEDNYVHEVYEKISNHFSETRHKPWPNVLKFVESFATGSVLVDVGCGNGKYFAAESASFQIGCDASCNLTEVCRGRGFECFACNCLRIPLRDGVADGCISIAVIHHLATEERRKKALEEIARVLRPGGGLALIYVWAKKQERLSERSSYLKQSGRRERNTFAIEDESVSLSDVGCDLTLPVHANRTDFAHNDLLVPWKLKARDAKDESNVYLRFYHVFEDDELRDLCRGLSDVDVADYYYDQGNWCVLLRKKDLPQLT